MSRQIINNNGSVYYSESTKRWIADFRWIDRGGVKRRKRISGKRQSEVKDRLADFKKQLLMSSGEVIGNKIHFEEYARNWFENTAKNSLKPSSATRLEVTLNNQVFPHIGDLYIDQINHDDIQQMVNQLHKSGLSYSTVKKAFEATRSCIKDFRIRSRIPFDPCEGITLPVSKKKELSDIKFFTEDQCTKIINEATRVFKNGKPVYRLGHAIPLLLYTGLRIGELIALRWDDIDFENKTISITKNAVVVKSGKEKGSQYILVNQASSKTYSSTRLLPMSQIALESLLTIKEFNGDKQFVMSTSTGKQITPRNINRLFHSVLTQTGIASCEEDLCGVHTLRHTFASMLFRNGCDVKVVSDLLGHSDTKITENIYIHLIQKQKIKAIADIDKYSS